MTSDDNELEEVTVQSSDGVQLVGNLVVSSSAEQTKSSAVLLLHGFPSRDVIADRIGGDMVELCHRVAGELGWHALTVRFRGCGSSTGEFSLAGWVDDASAAMRFLQSETNATNLWVAGFGTGGSVGLVAAADNPSISGVAMAASPADFDDWAERPDRLMAHAREVGAVKSSSFPADRNRWESELREVRAVQAAERFTDRPLLVLHGSEDDAVPHFDARMLADAHGAADLRFVQGGGHQLRHDPRAIAVLIGWLGRQSTQGSGTEGPN